jgi:hypothetical protein
MTENASSNELEALFVDDDQPAIDGALRMALAPVVGFTRDGKLVPKPPFLKLPDTGKILAALLARQAMTRLKIAGATLEATAETLADECAVPVKSCREHLSRFKSRKILDKNDNGYFLPVWSITEAAELVRPKN